MSLMKRGNVWWAYFYIDGIRHQHSTGTSNKKQAELIEMKLKSEANAKRFQVVEVDPKLTFAELVTKFIASGDAKKHHLDRLKFLLPYFSDIQIKRITHDLVAEYRKYRHSQKILTVATLNRDVIAMRHILYWGLRKQLIVANPLRGVPMERERRKKRPIISVAEEIALIDAAAKHLKEIIAFALDTGMRRIEILNQQWEDVDFFHRLLYVTRSKTPEGEAREIPLTDRVLAILEARKQKQGLVFTFQGEQLLRVKTAWKSALLRAQVRHFRLRDLRHAFNNRLIFCGVEREIRKSLMGHADSETHDIYINVDLKLKTEAIGKLHEWWKQEVRKVKEQQADQSSEPQEKQEEKQCQAEEPASGRALPKKRPGKQRRSPKA